MLSVSDSRHQKSHDPGPSAPGVLWSVDLKLTHLDWNPEANLIHFQGEYLTICDLDYTILQGEIQNTPKTKASVEIGEFCLVEDLTSARWYRGRIHNRRQDLFDVFLIDHGNVLSVDISQLSSCSRALFTLPPKIVCGFLANVLLFQGCSHSVVEDYFTSKIGKSITGYIQAILPYKVLILETPDINNEVAGLGFGRHMDKDTFLLLVEILTEVLLEPNTEQIPDSRGLEFYRKSSLHGYENILSFCGPRLICGTNCKVRVTAAVNPGLFYCQLVCVEEELKALSQKLSRVSECRSRFCNHKPPENVGPLCLVKGKDEKWYRGFVQFLPVNSQVRVLFIDYGFYELVSVEDIHRLPLDFCSTPIMAFPCSLLSTTDMVAKSEQLSFLKTSLLGGVLNVEIISFDEDRHLYTIRVLSTKDDHQKEPEPKLRRVETEFEPELPSRQGGFLHYETVITEAFAKTIEAEKVQVGSPFVGYVEHVDNPNRFWIRTQKRNDEFEEMMKKMTDIKLDEEVLENPQPGTLCAALYEKDMHFYRAVVTDTLQYGSEVLFIDFGNIEKVPTMLIKKIPEACASNSGFALCCTLNKVFPVCDIWTSTNNDFFRRLVSNKALLVHIVKVTKYTLVVDLYEMGGHSQSITEPLIAAKQAACWTARDGPRKNVSTDISGVTVQVNDCKQKSENDAKFSWEVNPSKNLSAKAKPVCFKPLSIKPGSEFAVRCSYFNSPADFWCQPLSTAPAFEELMTNIQQHYTSHTTPLQSGESCCIVKSPQDGRWYRAFIIGKEECRGQVMLVDLGMTIQIEEGARQAIIPEYVELEEQAFRCSLYNLIEPVDPERCGEWGSDLCSSLENFVKDSSISLTCKVTSQLNVKHKGLCNVVNLCNTKTQQSITDVLVEQSLAREVRLSTKRLLDGFPESFVYSSFDLSIGSEEQVFITHVSSQWEVYCQLERNGDIYEAIENKILEERDKMLQDCSRVAVQKMCLAKYLDGNWYRGLAQPVQSPLHFSVFFVDYGNTNVTEKMNVMLLLRDSELLYIPVQALRLNLAAVSRDVLYADAKEWLDGAILSKQVKAVIVGKSEDGSFDARLFDGHVDINKTLAELILRLTPKPKVVVGVDTTNKTNCTAVNKKQRKTAAKYMVEYKRWSSNASANTMKTSHKYNGEPRRPSSNCPTTVAMKTSVKSQWEPQKRSSDCSAINTMKTSVKSQWEPQKRSSDCSAINTMKTSVKSQWEPQKRSSDSSAINTTKSSVRYKLEPRTPSSNLPTTDSMSAFHKTEENLTNRSPVTIQRRRNSDTGSKLEQSKHTNEAETPQLSCLPERKVSAGQCYVSHVNTASDFFLQLSDDESAILKMREDLNSPQRRESLKLTTLLAMKINDLALTVYEEDDALYRCVVRDYVEDSRFKVEFVDYGNSAVVGTEQLYCITKDCLSQPRFSIPCCLSDTCAYESDAAFTDAVMEKPLMVDFVRQVGSRWAVHITILDGAAGLSYGAADESGNVSKEEEIPSLPEIKESCEELFISNEMQHNQKPESETSAPFKEEKLIVTPSPPTQPTKLRVKLRSRICVHTKTSICKGRILKSSQVKRSSASGTIQANETAIGIILSVLRNGCFYVTLVKNREQFVTLESSIADNLSSCNVVAEEDVKEGFRYLVQGDKNQQWHRAVVQHTSRDKCEVILVDYGITDIVSHGSIRQLGEDLTRIPDLAVLCKMNMFEFSEREGAHKLWYKSLMSLQGKEVKLVFVDYVKADNLWLVEIVINELFLISQITESQQQGKDGVPQVTKIQNVATSGASTLDQSPQRLFFAPVHVDLAYCGFAGAVRTPFEFCVVLEDLLVRIKKVSVLLNDLPEELPPLSKEELIPGSCCLLKSENKKWCRAEIIRTDTMVELNLVDYGHSVCIQYKDYKQLKRLPEELMGLPKVVYPCRLRGVKPDGLHKQWTEDALVFFRQHLYSDIQIFFREFVSNTHWEVDILADGIHVAKEMVDAGHAKYADVLLGLRFQKQSVIKVQAFSVSAAGQHDHQVAGEGCDGKSGRSPAEPNNVKTSVAPRARCFLM
ncbi:tudor domain-containing protein 15 [Thalassophryne amazonica]|uniref:tudor domain-containing protein 15 n=1 Tax=Thalassophryne amazonica TaxID=390379 RepID=UPI001470BBC0|nr:tudor domain-containing protein 15 [Thalassophryne amazonica]